MLYIKGKTQLETGSFDPTASALNTVHLAIKMSQVSYLNNDTANHLCLSIYMFKPTKKMLLPSHLGS